MGAKNVWPDIITKGVGFIWDRHGDEKYRILV